MTLREMAIEFVQGDFGRHYETDCDLVEALLVRVEQAAFEMAAMAAIEEADRISKDPDIRWACHSRGAKLAAVVIRELAKERSK